MFKFHILLIALIISTVTSAQCTGGSSGGALSPAPTGAYQTMNAAAGDFYYTFVVAATACFPQYDFSFCAADGRANPNNKRKNNQGPVFIIVEIILSVKLNA